MRPGKRNLITDVEGLLVGNAQDRRLKSGATVLTADAPFVAGVHVMGGAPGTRETDLLAPERLVDAVDALVLAGGSAFGLNAASGVTDALRQDGRGFATPGGRVPIVPAAIIFDLANGGDKDWEGNPYDDLGRAAYAARGTMFDLGTAGAGTGATAGPLAGGLGSASAVLRGGATVGALVAANPRGWVAEPNTGRFWAAPFEEDGEFGARGAPDRADLPTFAGAGAENTSIAIVATDVALSKAQATHMATAAHAGIARAVVPSHTLFDGDLVFAVSTGARPLSGPAELAELAHAASVALSRAIARAVFEAQGPGAWAEAYG